MDKSLTRFVYLLVAVAAIFIIILGIRSSAYIINSILLAAMITIAVLPIPRRLIKRGWKPSVALIVTLLVVVGVLALVLFLAWVSIGRMSAAVATSGVQGIQGSGGQDQVQTLLQRLRELASDENSAQILGWVVSASGQFIGQAITVLMILIFMLSAVVTTPISKQLEQVGGSAKLDRFTDLTQDVQQYISITTMINALVGLLNTIFLAIVGIDFAILWGILAWLFGYIPVVGFWLALIPPVLLAWAQFGMPTAILVFAAYVVINGSAENLIKPRIMGQGLDISPLVIFVSLVFWGWVLGGAGAILAVPLTLTVFSILRSFEATKWIVDLGQAAPAEEHERDAASQRLRGLWDGATRGLRGDSGEADESVETDNGEPEDDASDALRTDGA